MNALAYPPQVKIHYEDASGNSFYATADVSPQTSVPMPVNDESVVGVKVFKVSFTGIDGRRRTAYTTENQLNDFERLRNYRDKNPGELLQVPRTSGGFSPGAIQDPYLKVVYSKRGGGRLVTAVGTSVAFDDFLRAGSSRGNPVMSFQGEFASSGYSKRLEVTGWNGDGSPKLMGSSGKYTFPDLTQVDMKQQRFLLDFGKHPYDGSKQLLYPVYVDHYEGEDAIIIAPHELQKVERAKKGEKVRINFWTVPKSYLRVAPNTAQGDELLQRARLQFVDDERQVAEKKAPIETIIRANRHNADASIELTAGSDLENSMISFRASVKEQKTSRERDRTPGECGGAYDSAS